MKLKTSSTHVHLLLTWITLLTTVGGVRWTYNPGCDDNTICGGVNMLHVQSAHAQYLWSSLNGVSGIIVSGNDNLTVNWTKFNDADHDSISVSTPSSMGITLKSLIIQNTTSLQNQTISLTGDNAKFHIDIANETSSGESLVFAFVNSFMRVQINVTEGDGRMEEFPKLQFSENTTLFDLFIDMEKIAGLKIPQPDKAVLVVETVTMHTLDEVKSHSFDDEATPWLFTYEIVNDKEELPPDSPTNSSSQEAAVHAMWRPVVYVGELRRDISQMELLQVTCSSSPTPALITRFYSKPVYELHLKISPPDGKKFLASNFAWTVSFGRGEPLKESLSLLGRILTLVVVALPCAALVLGVALVAYKRRASHPGGGYRAI